MKKTISSLLSQLRSEERNERLLAIRDLEKIKEIVAKSLIKSIDDKNPNVQVEAIRALWGFAHPPVLKAYVKALHHPNIDVRENAANALECFGDPTHIRAVEQALARAKDKEEERTMRTTITLLKKKYGMQ
ncbi:hypothetical protein GF342_00895 [Candidatus Woesearchaeota archaeon]|nr:hypothetical protein [Candidatus Woesearchaeota archaeon]